MREEVIHVEEEYRVKISIYGHPNGPIFYFYFIFGYNLSFLSFFTPKICVSL
jgi:hypothetical protein